MLRQIARRSSKVTLVATLSALLAVGVAAYLLGRSGGDSGATAATDQPQAVLTAPTYEPEYEAPAYESESKTPPAHRVLQAKMIGPTDAWAITQEGLALTPDSGVNWRSITPDGVRPDAIIGVSFEDLARGFAVVSPNPSALHPSLFLFRTVDGGQTWERSEINDPRLLSIAGADVSFLGEFGTLVAREQSPGGSNSVTRLYISHDWGRSWQVSPERPPVPGELKFVDESVGWVAGGVGLQSLWHTEDGGASWTQVELQLPPDVSAKEVSYRAPEISDDGTGLLPVTFSKPENRTEVEVYKSIDGGKSWQPGPVVPVDGATEPGLPVKATFPDQESVAIVSPGADALSVVESGSGDDSNGAPVLEETIDPKGLPSPGLVELFDDRHGLALITDASCDGCSSVGTLFFTTDGGKSWRPSPSQP